MLNDKKNGCRPRPEKIAKQIECMFRLSKKEDHSVVVVTEEKFFVC